MLATKSKHEIEVRKVTNLLKYRGVRSEIRDLIAKRYSTQYVYAQCKQQDYDTRKGKYYRNPAGDIVARITKSRALTNFVVEAEPTRRPYKTCPFITDQCFRCWWYNPAGDDCTA